MTLQELQVHFGRTDGYIYKCSTSKTDMDLCNELQQSQQTFSTTTEKYIFIETPTSHPDYQLITE